MTDSELLMAFVEYGNFSQTLFMNFVTIIFAYLIAGFFVADKLNFKMAVLVTILFSITAFQEAASMLFAWNDAVGLMPQMQTREALQFHGLVSSGGFAGTLFYATYSFVVIVSYIGALTFFFHQRHQGRKAS